jgi:hypothetical protein
MDKVNSWTCILIAGLCTVLVLLTIHTWHDPDIWYHLNIARAMWTQGTFDPTLPFLLHQEGFVNFYWLFEMLAYFLFKIGDKFAVQGLFTATWLAMGFLWARTVRLPKVGAWGIWLGLLSLAVVQTRFVLRADIQLMLFLFGQALLMQRMFEAKKVLWPCMAGILLLQILAANFQTYFVLGPALAGLYAFAETVRARKIHLPSLGLFFGMLVASCVSPHGVYNWVLIFHYFSIMGQLNTVLMELGTPMARHFFEWAYWAMLALTAVQILRLISRKNIEFIFIIVLAIFGCALSMLAARNVPFLVLFSAPLYAQLLPVRKVGAMERWILLGLMALFVWGITSNRFYEYMHVSRRFGIGVTKDLQPIEFADWLETQHLAPARIFNEPSFGGYLAWRFPQQKWFSDSRYVEPDKILAYFATLNDKAKFDAVNKSFDFEGVLLNKAYSPTLAPALWNDSHWRPIYQDDFVVFMVRR